MKLCTYVIPRQVAMFREFLEASASEFELVVRHGDETGDDARDSVEFKDTARRRMAFLLETVRANPGETILHAEADIIFTGAARQRIEELVADVDLVAMQAGNRLNVGFMAVRSTPSSLALLETIVADPGGIIARDAMADEMALAVYKRMVNWRALPYREFWNLGATYRKARDRDSFRWIAVPPEIRVFHACFCADMELKTWLLRRVREVLDVPAPRCIIPLPDAEP